MTGSGIVAGRILRELLRTRRTLFFWVLFPTLMLLLFGSVYEARDGGLARSFTRTAPGILIGAALFFSCLSGPLTVIVGERERGTIRRLLVSPLSGVAYFLGVLWAHAVIAFAQGAIVFGITKSMGGAFQGELWLGALIVVLSVAVYSGIGVALGAFLAKRTEDATGPVAAIGVPLLVLGGTFFPSALLPDFLFHLAQFNPIFHMNNAMRSVWTDGSSLWEVSDSIVLLTIMASISIALGAVSYRAMLGLERAS